MIPVKLHMRNFGPFEDSEINFDFSSSLITGENVHIAGASNGTGKSTIFQALAWVLTGYSRYKNSASIIRDKTDATKVTLDFNIDTVSYRIIRGRNRTNKQTLDFFKINKDGTKEAVKADTSSKLDDKIAEITKIKYDSFLNTCYFAQNSISEFMYGTAAVRQKLIAEILDLDRWNQYAKKASAHLSEAEGELDILKFKMNTMKSGEQRRATLLSTVATKAAASSAARVALAASQDDVARLTANVAAEAAALQAASAFQESKADLARKSNKYTELSVEHTAAELQLSSLAEPAVLVSPGEQPAEPTDIASKLADRRGELKFMRSRISAMENGECGTCGTKWDHDHNTELAQLKAAEQELVQRIKVGEQHYNAAIQAGQVWREAFSSYQHSLSAAESARTKKSALVEKIASLSKSMKSIDQECQILRDRMAIMPVVVSADSSSKLESTQEKVKELNESILTFESQRASAQAELDMISSMTTELAQMNERRQKLEELVGTYSVLSKHFGKTGIQANILDTVIAEIETLANKFMSRLNYKPFTIRFVTQKPDTKGQIKETLDVEVVTPDSVKYIEDLSGGEQFRVAFSVRLALATVQARRQGGDINILLLDEVSSSLDKVGIETFVTIIRELEKTMKVMLITHDDSLKEHFDTTIHVQNNGATARIIQK